uniref:RMI1_C domain-containing protein n=1 Tax=Macrostomum lignano TaxID=282301 RepID=A0A1I8F1H1_9PLAT
TSCRPEAGGGGSGGKSVHFSLDSPAHRSAAASRSCPPPATAATPRPTMRNQLLLTDFSEEETAAEPEAETAVFLTAKPPVPKPRTDRRSASLNRQRAQPLRLPADEAPQLQRSRRSAARIRLPPASAAANSAAFSRPDTDATASNGGPAPAAASTLRCLPPPQSPPVPRQRRRLSVSSLQGHRQPLDEPCRGLSAYSTPLTQAAESDEVGQHRIDEDNATVKPEFVGTALGQLLQTRLRHSQSFSGGSAGADDEVLRFDLENALTTARRPQGPKRTASRAERGALGSSREGQQLDNVPGLAVLVRMSGIGDHNVQIEGFVH